MAVLKRESVEVRFQPGNSRLRIPSSVALAIGLANRQDTNMIGFLRAPEELACTTVDDSIPSLATVLELDAAHDGPDVSRPDLESLPSSKAIVGPDRIVRFQLKWISDKQVDLQLTKETAEMLGRTEEKNRVRVITWKGWLIVMSKERYDGHRVNPW